MPDRRALRLRKGDATPVGVAPATCLAVAAQPRRPIARESVSVESAGVRPGVGNGRRATVGGRRHEAATSTPADLSALAASGPGLVGRPLMRGAFFVCRAASLARDLALLFGRHRGKSTAFFAYSVHCTPPDSRALRTPVTERLRRAPPALVPAAPGRERVGVQTGACPGRRPLDPFQASGWGRPWAHSRPLLIRARIPPLRRHGRLTWTTRCVPAQPKRRCSVTSRVSNELRG